MLSFTVVDGTFILSYLCLQLSRRIWLLIVDDFLKLILTLVSISTQSSAIQVFHARKFIHFRLDNSSSSLSNSIIDFSEKTSPRTERFDIHFKRKVIVAELLTYGRCGAVWPGDRAMPQGIKQAPTGHGSDSSRSK